MAEITLLPRREDVLLADTWNAESVFATTDAWNEEAAAVTAVLDRGCDYQGRLAEGPAVLADWLAFRDSLVLRADKLYFYGRMARSCNSNDQAAAALADRGVAIFGRARTMTAFTEPEILAIGRDVLERWMEQEPRLSVYRHYFDNLFRRQAHVRSAEVEEVLGLAEDTGRQIVTTGGVIANADLRFEPAATSAGAQRTVAQSTINGLLGSPDRELRRSAWQHYADGYLALKNTLASNLTAMIKAFGLQARARRYASPLEASLHENNIPVAVFDNLIDTYRRNLPTWHRYWRIRRNALRVDRLHPYDVWAPLTSADQKLTFDQAVDWICAGLAPLGEEYVSVLRRGCLQDRWVDRYPNEGKRQGAFSAGVPGTYPFIMMAFAGELENMSTLAHELGHSMHSYLTWQNQPTVYGDYSLFVAEVASNFNQAMVRAHLLSTNPDRDFQIGVIEEAMSNFHRYFFVMPTLARFEREMHDRVWRGEATPADALIDLMVDLYAEGYGGEMEIDHQRVGINWAQFNHLYWPFYVYQYATGISAANALAKRILDGEPGAAENYLDMLKAGGSVYPLDALKIAGVDMTSPEPVNEAFAVFASFVDRLEELTS